MPKLCKHGLISVHHEISLKSNHLVIDKMIWWCELSCMLTTITMMELSDLERIPCHDICGLFMWNDINLSILNHPPQCPLYLQALTINASINRRSQLLKKGSKCTARSILIMLKMWYENESGRDRGENSEGHINLQWVNTGEQLQWPQNGPLHLFENIISTNQTSGEENGPTSFKAICC